MKNILPLMKSNPVVTASIVVLLVCIACLFVLVKPKGAALVTEMAKRKSDQQTIDTLMRTSVTVPAQTADGQPVTIQTTINRVTIDKLEAAFAEMKKEYDSVFNDAESTNLRRPMIERKTDARTKEVVEELLPSASSDAMRYNARTRYRERMLAMFGRPSSAEPAPSSKFIEDTLMEPRLNAGSPPLMEDLQKLWDDERKKFERQGLGGGAKPEALTEADEQKLVTNQREIGLKFIQDYSKRVTMYADTDWDSADFPLHVPDWVRGSARPEMPEIWEGQMAVWIQEDLVRAIAMANREGQKKSGSSSVVTAPVKRLLRIQVLEDYVGWTGSGGVHQVGAPIDPRDPSSKTKTPGAPIQPRPGSRPGGPYSGGPGGGGFTKLDSAAMAEDLKNQDPDQRLREAFNLVPSGRISNVLYDVRHAIVEVVVDYKQLPLLFNAIGKVNFMTVLNARVEDVDEHEALRGLIVLGETDCVQVRLLVETIWLRKWTTDLMPQEVRTNLGIVNAPAAPAATPGK